MFNPLEKLKEFLLVAVIVSVLGGAMYGHNLYAERNELRVAVADKDAQLVLATKVQSAAITVMTSRVQSSSAIKTKAKDVQVEIEKRLPAMGNCVLPPDWRVLHDAAAADTPVPSASTGVNAAAVTAKEAARTVTSNYEICHDNADRLDKLQQWIGQLNADTPDVQTSP